MAERDHRIPFRERLSKAPEYTQPFIANTVFGDRQEWPFQEVQPKNSDEHLQKLEFEAHGRTHIDTDPLIARVSYEDNYDLEVKRTVISRKYHGSEPLMQSAQIEYDFDDIAISYHIRLRSPIVFKETYEEPRNFQATILVLSKKDPTAPPVARMDYDLSDRIKLNAQFPYANYDQALQGQVEKREKERLDPPSYRFTYFQWEHLVGAKIGWTSYENLESREELRHYKQITSLNSRQATEIPESPYKAKISISRSRRPLGAGRLRFARMDSETAESWMFSVPEWISINRFHNNIQSDSFMNFLCEYPVVFCTKKRDEERQWHSTWGTLDKAPR